MNRLKRPCEALRLPLMICRQTGDALISKTDMGLVGEILFARMDALKSRDPGRAPSRFRRGNFAGRGAEFRRTFQRGGEGNRSAPQRRMGPTTAQGSRRHRRGDGWIHGPRGQGIRRRPADAKGNQPISSGRRRRRNAQSRSTMPGWWRERANLPPRRPSPPSRGRRVRGDCPIICAAISRMRCGNSGCAMAINGPRSNSQLQYCADLAAILFSARRSGTHPPPGPRGAGRGRLALAPPIPPPCSGCARMGGRPVIRCIRNACT